MGTVSFARIAFIPTESSNGQFGLKPADLRTAAGPDVADLPELARAAHCRHPTELVAAALRPVIPVIGAVRSKFRFK